ncbi:phosphoribosyltransferase family protein [Chitinophagaceae bacterium LY-5]|uniref:Phosphoribosyltransferase family protein n=2 Tax=Polluticaenibacter yanchengensis TaxID=3014562 RepID=A0ABT4UPA7_9BACT|nr:phosphoribosyltransferase family protein [Chitinophagaceae bacterium LY-5]
MKCLPATNNMCHDDNEIYQIFEGRLHLEFAAAYLFYNQQSLAQQLIHALKYKNRRDVGLFLGKQMGLGIRHHDLIASVDGLVPLPLHAKKLRKRGYNQASVLAEGVASIINKPILDNATTRRVHNATQTKKSRMGRWLNVEHIFDIKNPEELENKHLLIIDDVVTTGATIEAFGELLERLPNTRISVLSCAVAVGI